MRITKNVKQIMFESKIWHAQKNKKVCSYLKIQKCLHLPINCWKDGKFGNWSSIPPPYLNCHMLVRVAATKRTKKPQQPNTEKKKEKKKKKKKG